MGLVVGVPKETAAGETRRHRADVVAKLVKLGFSGGRGERRGRCGELRRRDLPCRRCKGRADGARRLGRQRYRLGPPPTEDEVAMLREGGTLIGFVWPAQNRT